MKLCNFVQTQEVSAWLIKLLDSLRAYVFLFSG